jgi:hypothetical protein
MKVALLGTTLELPDGPPPHDFAEAPEFLKLKSLLEDEFYNYFDVRISINNWEYIITRALTHRVA